MLQYGADRVVLATGSHWCGDGRGAEYGPIPGADAFSAACADALPGHRGQTGPGHRVLILDGDGHFMGIALAELMVNQGKK